MEVHFGKWDWLKPHLQRDAVITVADELDLVGVAMALSSNDTAQVQSWIDKGTIGKPSAAQIASWTDSDKEFRFVIVQPFVLIQEISARQ